MTPWTAPIALAQAWALAVARLARGQRDPRRRTARPLDPRSLSPHLARDVGLLDAGYLHLDGGAHGAVGQPHRLS